MSSGTIQRVQILLEQSRWAEARDVLEQYLAESPTDFFGRYYLIISLIQLGDKDRSRILADQLLSESSENPIVIGLSANIDLADEKFDSAESKADLLISLEPENAGAYEMKARANMGRRNYDGALSAVNKALELDAENVDAFNLKILISGLLGKKDVNQSIQEALELDANDPSTIANQGYQLVREGRINDALERLQYALSLEPTNQLARYAMMEALRARFMPYRLFLKYKELSGRLSAKGSWTMIIGIYLAYRLLLNLSRNNPQLSPYVTPLVYLLVFLFILTWVIDPLINLYLLTNRYGKILLDGDEKLMARLTGISFAFMVLSGIFYFIYDHNLFGEFALVGFGMMIPLGTFLKPTRDANRKITLYYTIAMLLSAFIAIIFRIEILMIGFLIALFVYQWLFNGLMIKENSRVFE